MVTSMRQVNLAEAKAHLSELVAAAASGEPICIMRRGKPVAKIVALESERRRIDPDLLRKVTEAMQAQPEPAAEFMRRLRDNERY
jgi:prevent-host-death family protein